MHHVIKSHTNNFNLIVTGWTTADVRKNDRDYHVGDTITLQCFNPRLKTYSGQETTVKVTGVIEKIPGLERGYCVLSLKLTAGSVSNFNPALAGKTEAQQRAEDRKATAGVLKALVKEPSKQ